LIFALFFQQPVPQLALLEAGQSGLGERGHVQDAALLIELRERVGVDTIMWSSDYPHHGNDWPYSRKVIEDTMGNIPADERNRMIGRNAVRIFNLDD